MAEVQAFKNEDVKRIVGILNKWNYSKEAEIVYIGCQIGLRIGDLLNLKFEQFEGSHLHVIEEKTKKHKRKPRVIKITDSVRASVNRLKEYYANNHPWIEAVYLFQATSRSVKSCKPISPSYYRRKQDQAVESLEIAGNYSSHSLRKTFGRNQYEATKDIAHVQDLLRHSSPAVTLAYIGITQETRDKAYEVAGLGF